MRPCLLLLAGCTAAHAAAPPPPAVRGCLRADLSFPHSVWSSLAGDTLSYCLAASNDATPYCFEADLATGKIVPAPAPTAVTAPSPASADGTSYPTATRDEGGVKVCTAPDACRVVAAKVDRDDPRIAISDDGALLAVSVRRDIVETWDLRTDTSIARFRVRYGTKERHEAAGVGVLSFFGPDVLAMFTPCAGPCGRATMYTARGKDLGEFPLEASESGAQRFHDDLWVATHEMGGFAIVDTRTGAVLQQEPAIEPDVVTSENRVVALPGEDRAGTVLIYDRAAHLTAKLETPRCP